MKRLADIFIWLVILLHVWFMTLEMVFWDAPLGRRIFGTTVEQAQASAALAANQGLYNGFLAAGLLWGLLARKRDVLVFFLLCVIVAGVFGSMTAKESILYVQAAPAGLALALTLMTRR